MAQTVSKEMSLQEAFDFAQGLQREGRLGEAGAIYRAILRAEPDHAGALMRLGVLSHIAGEREAGEALLRRAIEIDPSFVSARVNLGNLLREQRRPAEAQACYESALALSPGDADALCNLGSIHSERGEFTQAVASFERALAVAPDHAQAWHNMGNALCGLVRDHMRAGRREQALELCEAWLRRAPDDPVALHMIEAVRGDGRTTRASDAYVRRTFDAFAAGFDRVLEGLEYRAPSLVAGAVAHALGEASGALDVLDAGCGTGLVAQHVRPYARRLVGVDLSPGMLEKAKARDLYDDLYEAELVGYIGGSRARWDVITCADTLCYFGELGDFAGAALQALRPGGIVVFTVENSEAVERYRIEPHGRFSHARAYVERTLVEAGFHAPRVEQVVLRLERQKPVDGLLVTATRPGNE